MAKNEFQPKDIVLFTMPLYGRTILQGVVLSVNETENMGLLVNVLVSTHSIGLIQIHHVFLKRLLKTQIPFKKAE